MPEPRAAALHSWLSAILPAYPAGYVPDDSVGDYVTYEYTDGMLGDGDQSMLVVIWSRTESDAHINDLVDLFRKAITRGGAKVHTSDGDIWLKRGSPWAQAVANDDDRGYKRRDINITVEYFTAD